jgi:hypothetical protein
MLSKQFVVLAALFASSAAFAADTISIDVSRPAGTLSRAEVAAEAERALAAGEIKNGPLADFYTLVSPATVLADRLAKQAPVRKDSDTRVASAPSTTK